MKHPEADRESRRTLLKGTAAGVASAFLQPGCAVRGEPAARGESTARTVPTAAFLELSAVLTGLHGIVDRPEQHAVNRGLADEYWRRLYSWFPEGMTGLVAAYQQVNPPTSRLPVGDAVLARLRQTDEYRQHAFVARQIICIWYISQFSPDALNPRAPAVDGGRFERGMVWPLIRAHPPGFTDEPFGHWAAKP